MKKIILMTCILFTIVTNMNADFPINMNYFKNNLKEVKEFNTNKGKNAYMLKFFDLTFENIGGTKCIVGPDKKTDADVMIDISKYDYIKNEGSCHALVEIKGHWHKSSGFRAVKNYNSDDNNSTTVIWFYFEGENSAQLMICIFNDFQANANWIIFEQH